MWQAGDSNGLSDPYVILSCGKHTHKSHIKYKTLDPVYNQTFRFPFTDASPPKSNESIGVRTFDSSFFSSSFSSFLSFLACA